MTCPKCGDEVIRELPNSLACWDCYRAAIAGLTKAEVQETDARTRAFYRAEAEAKSATRP